MSAFKIQHLSEIEHILKRSDMYVGSLRQKSNEEYVAVFNSETDKYEMVKKTISYSAGFLRIFIEALSNAIDNVHRSKLAGTPCDEIRIIFDKDTGKTSVWNNGRSIPIECDDKKIYNHTKIFGLLRTGTNFDDTEERIVSGRNGMGIKLTNVFSKQFKVEGVNKDKIFIQEWSDNMSVVSKPIIKKCVEENYTLVEWYPDFEKFGMTGYDDDILSLFTKYVIDAGMLTGVDIFMNGKSIGITNLKEYSKLYPTPNDDFIFLSDSKSEVILTSSDDGFEAISFVNGVYTMNGGKHVDAWSEAIFRPIVEKYTKKDGIKIKITDVRQLYRLFVVSTLDKPEFTSQSKTELSSPKLEVKIDQKYINKILKWETTKNLENIVESKELIVVKKIEKEKRRVIEHYTPANYAGKKQSLNCTLAVCEGGSASSFIKYGINCEIFGKSGRDWLGEYQLRGKFLNVRNAKAKSISENRVICDLIHILGLKMDIDYKDDNNFSKLNYGRILVTTDPDSDGKHITGLIINFIHYLYPTLLEREDHFIVDMRTPMIRFGLKKKKEEIFYSLEKAIKFSKENEKLIDKSKTQYFKGLGSFTSTDAKKFFGKRLIYYVSDSKSDEAMIKGFKKMLTDERKLWLANYIPEEIEYDDGSEQTLTNFIDSELIIYSLESCKRSIPNIMDGLKESQRKILYACIKKGIKKDQMKVAQLSGLVASETEYHHGEANLSATIINMAQNFPTTNNIPLFTRGGAFGTRGQGGEDAAADRYIFTRLEDIFFYIFREEDDCILEYQINEGKLIEPKFYLPIIPMVLVNGCKGIGTGWSSNIPNFNPLDIIAGVKQWLEHEKAFTKEDDIVISYISELCPWYRGFTGTIERSGTHTFICRGKYTRTDKGVIVEEVPPDFWFEKFKNNLEKMKVEKTILEYRNYCTHLYPYFIIKENSEVELNEQTLKLTSNITLTNMVLYDEKEKIKKYSYAEEILDEFCRNRISYYQKRKEKLIPIFEGELRVLENRKRFILAVVNDEITIAKRKKEDIFKDLEEMEFDKEKDSFDYLLKQELSNLTYEKIKDLEKEVEKVNNKLKYYTDNTEKQIWLDELEELEKFYIKFDREMMEEEFSDFPKVPKK